MIELLTAMMFIFGIVFAVCLALALGILISFKLHIPNDPRRPRY